MKNYYQKYSLWLAFTVIIFIFCFSLEENIHDRNLLKMDRLHNFNQI